MRFGSVRFGAVGSVGCSSVAGRVARRLMPTTCGFPACKFRSRYRQGSPVPDNRHFYRVPKKPAELRQRWLAAIGRTEETIVSQVRSSASSCYTQRSLAAPTLLHTAARSASLLFTLSSDRSLLETD